MSRRTHTVKLPHGYRIECETVTRAGSRTAHFTAHVYDGSYRKYSRYTSADDLLTVGDLIRHRASWLDNLARNLRPTPGCIRCERTLDGARHQYACLT